MKIDSSMVGKKFQNMIDKNLSGTLVFRGKDIIVFDCNDGEERPYWDSLAWCPLEEPVPLKKPSDIIIEKAKEDNPHWGVIQIEYVLAYLDEVLPPLLEQARKGK